MADTDRKKELKEQYKLRHPDMGIVGWKSKDKVWVMPSKDIKADFNSTSFQLKLGSWMNREMQNAYNEDSSSFEWVVLDELEYEDITKDYTDDLSLLLMEYMENHPEAKLMKPLKKR